MAEPNPFDLINPTAGPSGRPTKDIVWDRKGGGEFPYEQRVDLAGQAAGVTTPDWFELLGQMLPETALNPNGGKRKRYGNLSQEELWTLESRVNPNDGSTKQVQVPLTMEKIFQTDAHGVDFLRDQNGMPIPNAGYENFAEEFQETINTESVSRKEQPVDPNYDVVIAGFTGGESEWESGSVVDRYVSNRVGLADVIKQLTPPSDPSQYQVTDTGDIEGNIHLTDPLVLQILNDELPIGNLLPELQERGRELGRLPFYVSQMYNSASNYVEKYSLNQLDFLWGFGKWKRGGVPNDVWHEEERYENSQWVAGVIKQQYEEWGNASITRETFLNDFVHKRIKDRLKIAYTDQNGKYDKEAAEQYYEDNYMSVAYRPKSDVKPYAQAGSTKAYVAQKLAARNLASEEFEMGQTLVPTMLFTPSDAEAILNYAFAELPLHSKFGVIAAENLGFAKGVGIISKARSASAYKLLYGTLTKDKRGKVIQGHRLIKDKKYETKDNPYGYKYPPALTDKEVHKKVLLEHYESQIGKSLVGLRFFPGEVLRTAGTARMGKIDADIKNRLTEVHSEVARINGKLSDVKNGTIKLTSKELTNLKKTKENLLTEATSLSFGRPETWLTIPGLSKLPRSAVMKETYKGEMVITAGQALGAEWIPHFFPSLSPQAGEMAGGLATLLKLHKIATFVPRKVGGLIDHYTYNTVSRIPEDFARIIEDTKWIPYINPGLIVNRTLDDLSDEILGKRGSRLSNRERESLKLLVGLTDHLSTDEKKQVFNHMAEVHELREKIISFWPVEERDFMSSTFSSTFAQISTLAPLQAMEGIGASLRFRDLASFNFRSMDNILKQSESSYQQAMAGVAKMKQMARTGVDEKRLPELNEILDLQEKRLVEFEEQLAGRAAEYNHAINIYKNFITGEGGVVDGYELTEDMLDELFDLEGTLRRFMTPDDPRMLTDIDAMHPDQSELGQLTAAKEDLNTFVSDMYDGLLESLDTIGESVTDPRLKVKRGTIYERLYNIEMWYKKRQVKEIWKPVDNALKNQRQDIAPFVEEFLAEVSGTSNEPIHKMFSPQGRFFQGYLGKRMHSSFKQTISKIVKGIKDEDGEPVFTAENVQILQQMAMKDPDINTPPDLTQLFFMLKNGDFEIANPALANVAETLAMKIDYSDLMDLHRAISNFGYSMAQRTDGIALQQAGFARKLGDSLLNILDNPTGFDQNAVIEGSNRTAKQMIQDAKSQTQAVYFDVTSRDDTIIKKITKSQKRRKMPADVKNIDITKSPTLYSYTVESNPMYFIDKFTKSFVEFVNKGEIGKKSDVYKEFSDLTAFFGQQVNGEIVFDLRKPVNHAKFKLFQKAINQHLYEEWDKLRFSAVGNLPAKDDWSALTDIQKGEFGGVLENLKPIDQATLKRMTRLQEEVFDKIKVIHADSDGKPVTIPFIDLEGMVQNDRRLEKILASSPKARAIARNVEADFNVVEGRLRGKIDARIARDKGHTKVLLDAFGSGKKGQNALSVTQNILMMTPEQLQVLKNDMTSPRVTELGGEKLEVAGARGDKPITLPSTMTTDEFEAALGNILLEGLFEIGGYGPSGKMMWTSGNNGTRYVTSEGFTDDGLAKLQKLLDVDHPDKAVREASQRTIEKLNVVLGEDATDALTTFARYFTLNQLQAQGVGDVKISGLMRDISPNELISRAFNLARGMVGPTYLAAELYLRVAGSHGIEVMNLALQNKEAGKLMVKMMETPANFTPKDAKDFVFILNEFVFTQLAMAGVKEINFGSDEQLQDLYYDLFREENVQSEFESPLDYMHGRPTNILLKKNQIDNSLNSISNKYINRITEQKLREEGARV